MAIDFEGNPDSTTDEYTAEQAAALLGAPDGPAADSEVGEPEIAQIEADGAEAAAVETEGVDDADVEVVEVIEIEAVGLDPSAELVDVVDEELDEDDEYEVAAEPSPYDRPGAGTSCTPTPATRTR